MISNWSKSFLLLLESEGGYVNNPSDPGGRTNLGVTQSTWEAWVGRKSNEKEMQSLSAAMVQPLYKRKYWDACCCDDLPIGVDYIVFDFAVNAGVGRSSKILQSTVGANPDGDIGELTIAAVNMSAKDIIDRFSQLKVSFYRSLPTFITFGNGWLNRVSAVQNNATSMT
jgi:lysozyme family protein